MASNREDTWSLKRLEPLRNYVDEWECLAFAENVRHIGGVRANTDCRKPEALTETSDAMFCYERLTRQASDTEAIWVEIEQQSGCTKHGLETHWSIVYFLGILECRKKIAFDSLNTDDKKHVSDEIRQAFNTLDSHLKSSGLGQSILRHPQKPGEPLVTVLDVMRRSSLLVGKKIQQSRRTKGGANADAIRFFRSLRDFHQGVFGCDMRRVLALTTNALYDTSYTTNDITKNL